MATSKEYLEFVLDQLSMLDGITYRMMMGEYMIYYHGKIAAYLCDDRLLVKILPSTIKLLPDARKEPPYEGAKDMLLVETVDDREFLKALFETMYPELSERKEKMNRMKLQTYIEETYGAIGECLWAKYPTYMVFRHNSNQKWFAAIMEIPREKLELFGGGDIQVVNLKCDTRLIGSFREEKGIYPAYHMSKTHWLTVALDGTVGDDKIKFLLDMSYDLTKGGRQ